MYEKQTFSGACLMLGFNCTVLIGCRFSGTN